MENTERSDIETRVDTLEVAHAVNVERIETLREDIVSGREKFKEIADALQDHAIAIELLKGLKSDVEVIKNNMVTFGTAESERKGAWKAIIVTSAVISFLIQFGGQLFKFLFH